MALHGDAPVPTSQPASLGGKDTRASHGDVTDRQLNLGSRDTMASHGDVTDRQLNLGSRDTMASRGDAPVPIPQTASLGIRDSMVPTVEKTASRSQRPPRANR